MSHASESSGVAYFVIQTLCHLSRKAFTVYQLKVENMLLLSA